MEDGIDEIATSLELSFVEQCSLQIAKLKKELLEKKRQVNRNFKRLDDHRLFKCNVFQEIEPRKKQYLEKTLVYTLKSLGSHIHRNLMMAARDSRSSLMSTPTPIRDLSCSSPHSSRTQSRSSSVLPSSRLRSDSNASDLLIPVGEVIVISSDEEEEDEDGEPILMIKQEELDPRSRTATPLRNVTNLPSQGSISIAATPMDTSINENVTNQSWPSNSVMAVSSDLANFTYDSLGVIHLKSKGKGLKYTAVKLAKQAMYLHIISKVLKLFETGSFMTKRELYYMSLDFCRVRKTFKTSTQTQGSSNSNTQTQKTTMPNHSQVNVTSSQQPGATAIRHSTNKLDKALDDLCCLIGCSKVHLRILPQSKGLVYGNLKFKLKSGEVFDCLSKKEGVNLPTAREPIVWLKSDANFILVIEKDSVLQKLLSQEEDSHFVENYKAILFTAKGYPDLNSRAFLNFLWSKLKIPILALTDADPHGLEIVCSYKFGSYSTAYESLYLSVPHMKWLGLLPGDVMRLGLSVNKTLAHTTHDIRKLKSLTSRPYLKMKPDWMSQLDIMKATGRKAELEALDSSGEYLVRTYLPNKLRFASWL